MLTTYYLNVLKSKYTFTQYTAILLRTEHIRLPGPGTQDPGPITRYPGPGSGEMGPVTRDLGPMKQGT